MSDFQGFRNQSLQGEFSLFSEKEEGNPQHDNLTGQSFPHENNRQKEKQKDSLTDLPKVVKDKSPSTLSY